MLHRFWTQRFFHRLAHLQVRHASKIVATTGIIFVLALIGLKQIHINANFVAFLPENFPSVQNLKRITDLSGGYGNFMVIIESGYADNNHNFAEALVQKLMQPKKPWVAHAEAGPDLALFDRHPLHFMPIDDLEKLYRDTQYRLEKEKLKKTGLFLELDDAAEKAADYVSQKIDELEHQIDSKRYYELEDSSRVIVAIWPTGSVSDIALAKKVYQELQGLVDELKAAWQGAPPQVAIGGDFRNKLDEFTAINRDLTLATLISVVAVFLLMLAFYGSPLAIVWIFLPLIMGIVITGGLVGYVYGEVNLITSFMFSVLMGLGVDYGIHFFSRYLTERTHQPLHTAIFITLYDTGRPALNSMLTTAAAFYALAFTHFKGFQQFGIVAGSGVLIIFFMMTFFFPALWVLLEKGHLFKSRMIPLNPLTLSYPPRRLTFKKVMVVTLLLTFTLPLLRFEYDFRKLKSTHSSYWQLDTKIHEVFGKSRTAAVVLAADQTEATAIQEAVEAKIPHVTTIDQVETINHWLPDQWPRRYGFIGNLKKLIGDNRDKIEASQPGLIGRITNFLDPVEITAHDLPPSIQKRFWGLGQGPANFVFIYDKVSLSDGKMAMRYAHDIGTIATARGIFHPAAYSIILADMLTLMKQEALLALGLTLASVFLLLWFDFQSLRRAILVMTPLFAGLVATTACMAVLGLQLNIFNIVAFPILVGIGIDSSVHLYHCLETHTDPELWRGTVNSVVLANLTSMVGFGSMIVSYHQGLRSLGYLSLVGLSCTLISSLTILPVLKHWEDRRKGHAQVH